MIFLDKTIGLIYAGAQIHNKTQQDKMNNNKVEIVVEKVDGGKTNEEDKATEKVRIINFN